MNTIIHIGAGKGEELPEYLASNAQHIILVEPNPTLAQQLRNTTADEARVTILETAIAPSGNSNTLHHYNLPEANSLYEPAEGLKQRFPGLKTRELTTVATLSPTELLAQVKLNAEGPHHLVIQAPGAEAAILAELAEQDALHQFATLNITSPTEPYYQTSDLAKGTPSSTAIAEQLQQAGFEPSPTEPAANVDDEDWPQWHFTYNPLHRELLKAQQRSQSLAEQLQTTQQQLEQWQSKHKSVELEASKAQESLEKELKSHEAKAKTEQEALNTELKKLKAELQKAKEQQTEKEEAHQNVKKDLANHKEWLANRKKEVETLKQSLDNSQVKLAELANAKSEFENRTKALKEELSESNTSLNSTKEQLQQAQQEAEQLKKRRDQLKKELEQAQQERDNAKQERDKAKQETQALQEQQKAFKTLQDRMEYLFDQNTLQLEQAANALGRHITSTSQSTARELEAGIALQQQYGGDLPTLEDQGYRLPSSVALQLARQLKAQPYDLIIEMGSGVSTTFMAHTLRSMNGNGQGEPSSEQSVARYIDASEDDLPKRILCFEHNRNQYNKLKTSLKNSPMGALVSVQFTPLVPYQHQGQEHLFYDCAQKLQQVARLFEEREARIFIFINPTAAEAGPSVQAALPQILQYLAAHRLDIVVNTHQANGLIHEWLQVLKSRAIEHEPAQAFGEQSMMLLSINS